MAAPPARVAIAAPGCAAPRRCLALTGRQSGGPTRDSSQSRNRLSAVARQRDPKGTPHRLVSYGETVTRMNVAGIEVLPWPPLF